MGHAPDHHPPVSVATPPVLHVDDVTRRYGDGVSAFTALDRVSLTVGRGESVAVVGKSGSGKTTLMHVAALLDSPTSGRVVLEGRDVSSLGASEVAGVRNRLFGFVFQQFFLVASSTVLENVAWPLTIAGVDRAERHERARAALDRLDLLSKAGNRATDLSGGQKQRVVIARALINDPEVIFADEPTGNLDSSTGTVVEDILLDLNRERGITLVVVTHDPELAARCGRQVTMRDGRVVGTA